jgi:hypothetical protein
MADNSQRKEVPQVEVTSRELGALIELDKSKLDPDYEYRWVHKSPLKVARARARGYRIVEPDSEDVLNAVGESPAAADNTYTIGDVVLMKIKRIDHRARRQAQKRKTDQRLKGPVRKFRKSAEEKSRLRGQRIEVITDKDPEPKD